METTTNQKYKTKDIVTLSIQFTKFNHPNSNIISSSDNDIFTYSFLFDDETNTTSKYVIPKPKFTGDYLLMYPNNILLENNILSENKEYIIYGEVYVISDNLIKLITLDGKYSLGHFDINIPLSNKTVLLNKLTY